MEACRYAAEVRSRISVLTYNAVPKKYPKHSTATATA